MINKKLILFVFYRKSGKTEEATKMFEKCIWLESRFAQAYVELLMMKPEHEKQILFKKLLELEPNNWEHYLLYGNWYKARGLYFSSANNTKGIPRNIGIEIVYL